jgi:hypothetical protein
MQKPPQFAIDNMLVQCGDGRWKPGVIVCQHIYNHAPISRYIPKIEKQRGSCAIALCAICSDKMSPDGNLCEPGFMDTCHTVCERCLLESA